MPAREDTYQKVMTALQKLARRGAAITVKTVAQQAGIARATLYNDALLLELVQRYERFCQVVEAETLIRQAGASLQSYPPFRRPALYL
jgi:AcrR family transcriptional regulator